MFDSRGSLPRPRAQVPGGGAVCRLGQSRRGIPIPWCPGLTLWLGQPVCAPARDGILTTPWQAPSLPRPNAGAAVPTRPDSGCQNNPGWAEPPGAGNPPLGGGRWPLLRGAVERPAVTLCSRGARTQGCEWGSMCPAPDNPHFRLCPSPATGARAPCSVAAPTLCLPPPPKSTTWLLGAPRVPGWGRSGPRLRRGHCPRAEPGPSGSLPCRDLGGRGRHREE